MITINENISLPDCWGDLTLNQAARTFDLSLRYLRGEFNLYDYRYKLLECYTGYKRSKTRFTEEEQEQINSNLFNLADMLKFPIKPHYANPELLEVLTPELKEKLQTLFPFEIYNADEIEQLDTIIDMLKFHPVLNLNLNSNPLPTLTVNKKTLHGVTFDIDENGDVHTDLTAKVYSEAYGYYQNYMNTKDTKYLNILVSILYRPAFTEFNLFKAQKSAKNLHKELSFSKRISVFYWFQSLMEWFVKHPIYSILFSGGKSDDTKVNLGVSETIFTLSKEGFGSQVEIGNELLPDFFNMQIKRLRDLVSELRAGDMKPAKIMQKTGLTPEQYKLL